MMVDTDRIRDALSFVPPDERDTWVKMGMAIKSEFGDSGFDVWDTWGQQADSYNSRDSRDVWKSIRANGKVTAGTLFHEAKANGWRDDGAHHKPTAEEVAERKRMAEERTRQENADIAREREDTARKAATAWKAATEAKADNPYLSRKQLPPVETLREIDADKLAVILGYVPKSGGTPLVGRLLVAPVKQDGSLSTLELIDGNGRKAALAGRGTKAGGYWATQPLPDELTTLLIGEGVATVLSAAEATGLPGIAALSASNLPTVAKAMRERCPQAAIVILADLVKATSEPDPHAIEAAQAVGGKLAIPNFGPDRDPDLTDFNDMALTCGHDAVNTALAEGEKADAGLEALPRAADQQPEQPQGEHTEDERTSQASQLVALVRESCDLFHDENRDVYTESKSTGEVRRIDGRAFRDWLVAQFYQRNEKSARDQSVRESIATLNGLGRFQGEQVDISLRVAHLDGTYFIDLAEPGTSRAVKIEAGRWSIIERPPVKFTRTEAMRPLPIPKAGGSLDCLWPLVNVPKESRVLVLSWLVECLRPETPFPVLELLGEQGSAKSTTQSILRDLIDPNACNLRAAPKTAEDAFVGAGVNWLVSYENVSYLPAPMQDALCVLATGGGFAKRKLYSDADESVIQVKRPIILNGIAACITAQDLIDRSVSIETPIITRRTEMTDLRKQFEQTAPELVGALFDTFAQALAKLPEIRLPEADQPRLIEFVRLGAAVAEVCGSTQQAFLQAFSSSREESVARTLDASPVAVALIEWWNARGKFNTEKPLGELFAEISDKKPDGAENWPRSAKGFGDSLRRVAPALRQMGIECRSLGKRGGVVCWSIGGKLLNPSPESPEVLTTNPPEQDIRTIRTSRRELSPAAASLSYDDNKEVF